jgi:MFS family permease
MYQVADSRALTRGGRALVGRKGSVKVSATVLLLGLTSLFTDISSEMVTTILPLYLVLSLGLSPLAFGVIDGIQQGASALVRVAAGFTADRFGRYKEVAVVGYGLSAVTRIGFLLAGRSIGLIGALVFVDRTGKGIRTAPRDAMIALSTPKEQLGTAFGVHRALDTAGAVIGPLIAFSLLILLPHDFDPIFFVSFCFALIGLAILVLFVENRPGRVEAEPLPPVTMRSIARLLAVPRFGALLVAGGVLALATMSDGFVYLGLQQNLDFAGRNLPLLYVATSLVYMLLAVPAGRLADRIGRGKVFVSGYLLLLVVYAAIVAPGVGPAASLVVILAFGAYYAATDGVLTAIASAMLPDEARATGLSVLVTVTSIARLVASIAFGATWVLIGVDAAVIVFAAGLVVAAVVAAVVLTRYGREPAHA